MRFLYTLAIKIYGLCIRLAVPFSHKASLWMHGRKGLFNDLAQHCNGEERWVWFHCASLGEFEQGRPVMEAYKKRHREHKILLTFFSPSGYEVRKDYSGADHVCYLPLDTPTNARRFLDTLQPLMAVFIKYEFWMNFFEATHKRKIPLYVISAVFRPEQHFFHWHGRWQRRIFNYCTRLFVQDELSADLLATLGCTQVTLSGDTRFDRVYEIAGNPEQNPVAEAFAGDKRVVIAGSTWPKDEDILIRWIKEDESGLKYIIAPHNVDKSRIAGLMKALPAGSRLLSGLDVRESPETQVLVVDSVGQLAHLYRYGHIAYVGGGFGAGIHNILEPAAFGLPVLFGPAFEKFREAYEMIERGAAFAFTDYKMFNRRMQFLLRDEMILRMASEMSRSYVREKRGAVQSIIAGLHTGKSA
ncbi:MAG: 3-deoxy-D-manno-octulosonic acid transferase [Flavobacteriales bacterium]